MTDVLKLLRDECEDVPWTGASGLFKLAADEIERLRDVLSEVRELIDGYVDVIDGSDGPLPNKAMRAQQLIDEVVR